MSLDGKRSWLAGQEHMEEHFRHNDSPRDHASSAFAVAFQAGQGFTLSSPIRPPTPQDLAGMFEAAEAADDSQGSVEFHIGTAPPSPRGNGRPSWFADFILYPRARPHGPGRNKGAEQPRLPRGGLVLV